MARIARKPREVSFLYAALRVTKRCLAQTSICSKCLAPMRIADSPASMLNHTAAAQDGEGDGVGYAIAALDLRSPNRKPYSRKDDGHQSQRGQQVCCAAEAVGDPGDLLLFEQGQAGSDSDGESTQTEADGADNHQWIIVQTQSSWSLRRPGPLR